MATERLCGTKVLQQKDDENTPADVHQTWTEAVQPIVAKCEVGALFGERVYFTKDGADALGKLLKEMAAKLDGIDR